MKAELNIAIEGINSILEAMEYEKRAKQEYTKYPSYEFKQKQLADVDSRIKKCKKIRDELKSKLKGKT